ncbi:universal stress protein [Rubrivirga sp. IMCC43871]|uniref:universal stress protein n=1 Tax=Rubrivirga sp. IMCC43871 TaxID=3391575 RepID=UPI00398FE332
MPAPLLVPTDFSPCAARAVAIARQLADATGAPLHVLHVLSWPDAGPFETPGEGRTATEEERGETDRARAALAAAVGADAHLAVVRGNAPAIEIADYAERIGAEVIVVGACGRRGPRAGLGGVAGEVVQTAPADVVVVPFGDAPPAVVGRVLVAVDFSGAAAPLVRLGQRLAGALGVGLDLVHVVEPFPHPVRWMDEAVVDLAPQVLGRAHEALRQLAQATEAGPETELYVERGKAARTLAQVAQALQSGLLIVGPHDDRPVLDGLIGSVAEGIARRAPCPVWVARSSVVDGVETVDARSYRPVEPTPATSL